MPTSAQDPEGARRQHDRLRDHRDRHDEFLRESDWAGMLLGIGFAVGGVLTVIAGIHLYLRAF